MLDKQTVCIIDSDSEYEESLKHCRKEPNRKVSIKNKKRRIDEYYTKVLWHGDIH